MANQTSEIVLSMQELREVTRYAAERAQDVLEIFERAHPADSRPRDAIDAAWTFLEVANAGSHCATPRRRHSRRPATQTPRRRAMRREQRCTRHPLRTCIHWPTLIR